MMASWVAGYFPKSAHVMALEAVHELVCHHTVSTKKVGAVEAPCNSTGFSRLAPRAIRRLHLIVRNSAHPIICQKAGNTSRSQLTVGLASRACDLLRMVLAALQAVLAECVEAGKNFGRDKRTVAHRALGVRACEASPSQW